MLAMPCNPHSLSSTRLNRVSVTRLSRLLCRSQQHFILYTKPECPLCDGLKDKLAALIARAHFLPSFLTDAELEVCWDLTGGQTVLLLLQHYPAAHDPELTPWMPPQVRDISLKEEWCKAYLAEVPVLAVLQDGGNEVNRG